MKTEIIMSIYPNTKGFGYAFFMTATKPIICGVVAVRPIGNEECMKRIEKLVNHFNPKVIVLEKIDNQTQKSKRVKSLIEDISKKYMSKNTLVSSYTRLDIRNVFKHFNATTKHEIACLVAKWFPQYTPKLPQYRKPWMAEGYSQSMFDAISLVLTHYYMMD